MKNLVAILKTTFVVIGLLFLSWVATTHVKPPTLKQVERTFPMVKVVYMPGDGKMIYDQYRFPMTTYKKMTKGVYEAQDNEEGRQVGADNQVFQHSGIHAEFEENCKTVFCNG
jgi:hypothetical protein